MYETKQVGKPKTNHGKLPTKGLDQYQETSSYQKVKVDGAIDLNLED